MAKKISFLILTILFLNSYNIFAQYMTSQGTGVFGAYYLSSLPNRDDLNADQRLDYVTTYKYGGGVEKFKYFSNNFGYGFQGSFWQTGQNYSGVDTATKYTYTAKTNLSYGKVAVLLHYRSYNRYKPEQRFRFSSYFGPYIGVLGTFSDKVSLFDETGKLIGGYTFNPTGRVDNIGNAGNFDLKQPIYKYIDVGLILAPGFQFMITPKLALAFHLRGDISATNVENTGNIDVTSPNPLVKTYDNWDNLYCKYFDWSTYSATKKDPFNTRPATKNLTMGAQITLRLFSEKQFEK